MTGKLVLENCSSNKSIKISLWSVDGNEEHLKFKKVTPREILSSNVVGGVKKIEVYQDNDKLLWKGYIPSYSTEPIKIYPENKTLTYKELTLVDLSSNNNINNRLIFIAISLCIILLILLIFWVYTK